MEGERRADHNSTSPMPAAAVSPNYLLGNALRLFEPSYDKTDGVLAQVPSMCRAASSQSYIRSAVKTLAMERLGIDNHDSSLLAQAQSEYGRTLLKVREALDDPVQSRQDEILVTIQLLCHFEFLRSVTRNVNFTHTHASAIPLLLKHRGVDRLQTRRSRTLSFCFQTRLLLYCIDRWYDFDEVVGTSLCEIPNHEDQTTLSLIRITREVNRVQTRIIALKQTARADRPALLSAARKIFDDGRQIDDHLHQWSSSIDEVWRYSLIGANEVILEEEQFADQIHVYPNIWIARTWNLWRTVRIDHQAALSDLIDWAETRLAVNLPNERQRLDNITQTMVDEICNTVHYHLGNRTPEDPEPIAAFPVSGIDDPYETHARNWGWFHLLVPLRTCQRAPALLPHQRLWIHKSLVRISRLAAQSNNMPTPTSPPVLITNQLPSNAFAFPMFVPQDVGEASTCPTGAELEFFQFENLKASPSSSPAILGEVPSQHAEYPDPSAARSRSRSPGQSSSAAPAGQASNPRQPSSVDLPFFNTTRPEQIKDPETQKKIRRDVMLHHMRTQDPKQREERQRKAREGSAARAASRREGNLSSTRKAGASGGDTETREGPGSKKRSSSSGKGKERAR